MIRTLKGLTNIKISPLGDKTQFRFHLEFGASSPPESLSFELGADGMMVLMVALQKLQATHKIPIPESVRTKRKPSLSVVAD